MTRFHELRVAQVRPETRDAMVVTFEPPADDAQSFRYLAGQHLTLKAQIGDEEVRRSYSI